MKKTVVASTAKNRTFENLLENPKAVYLIMERCFENPNAAKMNMEPGSSIMDWKGIQVYMRMKEYATSGQLLEMIRNQAASFIGEEAAKMLHSAVTFEIYEVRPLVDFGQSWEKSI